MGHRGKVKGGRNALCWCGSGEKHKNCHGKNDVKGGSPEFKTPPQKHNFVPAALRRKVELSKMLAEDRRNERLTWK